MVSAAYLVTANKLKVFISYDTESALEYARKARRILTDAGFEPWMWHCDRTAGAYPAEEIAKHIELCQICIYLCTVQDGTQRSNGQQWKRNLAWNLGRHFRVLTCDPAFIPLILQAYTYVEFSADTFACQCRKVAAQLATDPTPLSEASSHTEDAPLDSAG